ncbi:MAG: HDOD domain-containing protein, partial [Planctomycetota bacterium]|nr:HDOD domain-containing protein [Planctomycetota bacterium]
MTDSSRDSILYDPALPSLPSVALEVLELASREDVDLRDFERAIERDQAISIRILRTVNSSYYGLGKPCGSIRQAISYLGVKTLKALVLG